MDNLEVEYKSWRSNGSPKKLTPTFIPLGPMARTMSSRLIPRLSVSSLTKANCFFRNIVLLSANPVLALGTLQRRKEANAERFNRIVQKYFSCEFDRFDGRYSSSLQSCAILRPRVVTDVWDDISKTQSVFIKVVLNKLAVSSISLMVDTQHLFKLRDTPAARFFGCTGRNKQAQSVLIKIFQICPHEFDQFND